MNEILDLKMMTTAELAEVFGVGESTVKRAIEKVRPELGGVFRNNQGGYLFTEQQALLLKNEIAGHHNLANRQIDTVTSALEENEVIASAIMILQRRSEEYRQRAELAEQRAIVAETMNNRLMHTSKLYTVTEIAKEAGMKSAEALNRFLEEKKVQYKVNGTWVPTSKFANLGYFEIKQEVHDNGFVYYDRKVTQDGRLFILNLLQNVSA